MKKTNEAVNWNRTEDMIDSLTWDKLVEQFWTSTRIPVSNDLDDWRKMSEKEKELIDKVFGGLTLLDTVQSEDGMYSLIPYARTQHETAILNNISFMESMHAKSYSTIFSTLRSMNEIDEIFNWVKENPHLQYKANKINKVYKKETPIKRRAASVLLESFLFYSGFYTPLYYLGNSRMTNTGEIIKLIIRDESVHGTYIGYKFQRDFDELNEGTQEEIKSWVFELLYDLYQNEEKYIEEIYPEDWQEEVKKFTRYNGNKALQNLGFEALFPETEEDVNPIVMNGLSTGTANHDFFSQVGNGYLVGEVEAMTDDDYNYRV